MTTLLGFGCRRNTCSAKQPPLQQNYIDPKTNVVYGGDLRVPISDKSCGSILFDRMLRMDRREEIFQVCLSTEVSMTTRECLEKSVGLAEKLRESGLKKGDFIILIGNNSLNMNITLLAAVFSGAVAVPINHYISLHEFENIVKSLKPKFFGCDGKYLEFFRKAFDVLPEFDDSKIFVITRENRLKEQNTVAFEDFIEGRGKDFESFKPVVVENTDEELMMGWKAIREGSGVRVVGITHRNANSIIAQYDSFDNGINYRKQVILMVSKFYWMTGIHSLFMSTLYGAKLLVMKFFNEEQVLKIINDYRVTTMYLVSSKCWKLYKYTPKKSYDLSSCKEVLSYDELLPKTLVQGWKEKFGIALRPAYATSEIAGFPLVRPPGFTKEESSGKVAPNLYAKVTSLKTSKSMGPMEAGEICFKGPQVTKGYIYDGTSSEPLFDREGFLLTGHYGYYDKDGDFYVVEKITHQIKYQNYEISPLELEGIIKLLEPIKDVCVTGIKHPKDGNCPIAFVTLQPGIKMSDTEILNFVNSRVPQYKRLWAVFFITKIPRFRATGGIKRNLFADILSTYQLKDEEGAN